MTLAKVEPFTPFSLLTTVDILQLAGGSLIVMAALRAVVQPGPAWLAVAAVIVFVAPFLHGHTTGVPVVDAALGMLWRTADTVYYPVFPWAAFPIVGAVVGHEVIGARDRPVVLRRAGAIGLCALALGAVLILVTATPLDITTYWRLPPVLFLAILGFVLAWVWLCDIVTRRPGRRFGLAVVRGWSGRVTSMHVIHWLLISWGVAFVGFRSLALEPALAGTIVVLVATIVISRWLSGALAMGPANKPAATRILEDSANR